MTKGIGCFSGTFYTVKERKREKDTSVASQKLYVFSMVFMGSIYYRLFIFVIVIVIVV